MKREGFIIEAGKWLSVQDFAIISSVDINNFSINKKDTSLLKQYKEFEQSIRTELALLRTAKKKGSDYKISKDLSTIFGEDNNPLQIEIKLLLLRWSYLEEQEINHFFDLDFLIIYYLKLQITERLASFDNEKGRLKFQAYSSVEL